MQNLHEIHVKVKDLESEGSHGQRARSRGRGDPLARNEKQRASAAGMSWPTNKDDAPASYDMGE